ncbi:hypothetical protein AYO40_02585 [Planctomycetaceae bacterium SCGC AG-212-D15]|nr:hypothetical protein AYO40_02585 [Planctomycetaceae bacterium SCGC AG-212-D15]
MEPKSDRGTDRLRLEAAGKRASEVVDSLGISSAPVDPIEIACTEAPLLHVIGDNFRDRFDGQLEYHRRRNRFLLFYNTKYDDGSGRLHPRTRFSIAHELGHFFIERHHSYLFQGGKSHGSCGEFTNSVQVEREADTFAANLLMPARLIEPSVDGEPTFLKIRRLADRFQTSVISTAIRWVQLSDLPCAIAAIHDGAVAWIVPSSPLIRGGCYPKARATTMSPTCREQWELFRMGGDPSGIADSTARYWFETYDRDDLPGLVVTEEYQAVRVMNLLLVLLAMEEGDLIPEEEEEGED